MSTTRLRDVRLRPTAAGAIMAAATKDLIQAAHQPVTRECWATRARFNLFVSAAVVAEARVESLVTWNLRHLANAAIRGKIDEACRRVGLVSPIICTPEELMEPVS